MRISLDWSLTAGACTVIAYFSDLTCLCTGLILLVHCFTSVHFLPVVAKMEAQSSTEFIARHNNKPGSVISTHMGGANKGCIYMWDSAAEYIQPSSADV